MSQIWYYTVDLIKVQVPYGSSALALSARLRLAKNPLSPNGDISLGKGELSG